MTSGLKKPYRIALLALAVVLSLAVSGLIYLRKPPGSPSQLLVDAARKGDTETVVRLLTKGADINGRDGQGYAPLHAAVWYNQTNVVPLLLQKGADVNAPVWGRGRH